jgi:hypothetical protein
MPEVRIAFDESGRSVGVMASSGVAISAAPNHIFELRSAGPRRKNLSCRPFAFSQWTGLSRHAECAFKLTAVPAG